MPYKQTYIEEIDPAYAGILTWETMTSSPERLALIEKHKQSGNIISYSNVRRENNPLVRDCEFVYKDQATREFIMAESAALPNKGLVPGFSISNMTFHSY